MKVLSRREDTRAYGLPMLRRRPARPVVGEPGPTACLSTHALSEFDRVKRLAAPIPPMAWVKPADST